jgi:hypothetical protein
VVRVGAGEHHITLSVKQRILYVTNLQNDWLQVFVFIYCANATPVQYMKAAEGCSMAAMVPSWWSASVVAVSLALLVASVLV